MTSEYVAELRLSACRYLSILEGLFGSRDPRFIFGTIRKALKSSFGDRPRIHFPCNYFLTGRCIVDINVTEHPWEHCCIDQGKWQVAHECVHLIDPGKEGSANVLEEGLASWFQNNQEFHDDAVNRYIHRNLQDPEKDYETARLLVVPIATDITQAVKDIRRSGMRIRDIKPDILGSFLPNIEKDTINGLCTKWPDFIS